MGGRLAGVSGPGSLLKGHLVLGLMPALGARLTRRDNGTDGSIRTRERKRAVRTPRTAHGDGGAARAKLLPLRRVA